MGEPDRDAAPAPAEPAGESLGLTEATLEALLFVAERPLGRREIAALAGVDRETVDARIGDLEVEPGGPRDPARRLRRPGRAGDRARGGPAHRALRRRRRDAALAGGARDPRDRGLPPAGHPGRRRADPGRRLGLHDPGAAPPPAHRRARPGRDAGPALPLRDRLRVPRAVRADQPRRPAAARRRRRRPARRVDRRERRGARRRASTATDRQTAGPGRPPGRRGSRSAPARVDGPGAAPEGHRRGRDRVAPRRRSGSSPPAG